jgi:hypothetical protein
LAEEKGYFRIVSIGTMRHSVWLGKNKDKGIVTLLDRETHKDRGCETPKEAGNRYKERDTERPFG